MVVTSNHKGLSYFDVLSQGQVDMLLGLKDGFLLKRPRLLY